METKIITLTLDQAEALFFFEGEEGQNVCAKTEADVMVHEALGLKTKQEIKWNLPDVFSIRYGSCYVGTATINGMAVRFVTNIGDWKEGDDK
jgi:hypothetical protein